MKAIEIARKFAAIGSVKEAREAYHLAIHENDGADPAEELEAAVYIFQSGGNYQISYTCFRNLYNRGFCRDECLNIMTQAFYEPNAKEIKRRYARNCAQLKKYPYLFRKDFLPFEELPIRFYPYDDDGYLPFYPGEERFGEYYSFHHPVISRNFFKDLDNPVLARDVFSQYELEYLNDNVRKSEHVARENHIYLHYTDWGQFCAHLQCLNLRPLLKEKKFVFLIGDEVEQYPIDFKERFGIDYSTYPVKPIGIRDISRLIWHTQLSAHNGGDFFNEVFDAHPNLVAASSVLLSKLEKNIEQIQNELNATDSVTKAVKKFYAWEPRIISELYRLKDRTAKDILVGLYLRDTRNGEKLNGAWLDRASRIAPAIFFQPHFYTIRYRASPDQTGCTTLHSEQYEQICESPIFKGFKYIKTFTPMRRMTTSYGGTLKFMRNWAKKKGGVIDDVISQRLQNRSYMIDWQNRLFQDSVLVRFEDGKLNPKATFTALAAFLDLPYTESMTRCTMYGKLLTYNGVFKDGFDTQSVYRSYDDFTNDSERYFMEYFLRDVYEYYGYDFLYYDGAPMDMDRVEELVSDFSMLNHYIHETFMWNKRLSAKEEETLTPEEREKRLEELSVVNEEKNKKNQIKTAQTLLRGLRFINKNGQPLHMMPRLELDPALLEQPLYH